MDGNKKSPFKPGKHLLDNLPLNKPKDDLIATKIIELGDSSIDVDKEVEDPHSGLGFSPEATVIVRGEKDQVKEQVAFQVGRPAARLHKSEGAAQAEAQIGMADNLRVVQKRLNQIEIQLEKSLRENESLQAQIEQLTNQNVQLSEQLESTERQKSEINDQLTHEAQILRDNLQESEKNLSRVKQQNEQLESRLTHDFRKIRVRERELENRLEIAKIEKEALIRAKDDVILDLKRKLDENAAELGTYKARVQEMNKSIDANNKQLVRTVRTLRLALSNLEGGESTSGVPFKKAE